MSMKRTTIDGQTLNERTARMLGLWQFNALQDFYVVQGSYNAGGVSASAGTHDGGGALDISVYGMDLSRQKYVAKQGRLAGFMAYHRTLLPGVWNPHIHAGALGDKEASAGLKTQFDEYRRGEDALADHAPDQDPRVPIHIYPNVKLKKVNFLNVYLQFRSKKPKASMSVKRVQWVLNEKTGTNLVCDGVAGPSTREAYKKWEKKIGSPSTDGLPGRVSLKKLGEHRFGVSFTSYEKWVKTHVTDKAKVANYEKHNPTFLKK